jgi:DNA-binding response OmpR family regulator
VSKRKLLLADDSITIQKVVKLTFADEGIEVVTASDGDAALEKFNESAPDLVLADVNMPGLNGYQLCEKIKNSDSAKKTPVILLVGSFEPFDEAEARRVGADDSLTKPFQSIRQLVNKVSDLLNSNGETLNDETNLSAENEDLTEGSNNFAENVELNSSGTQTDDESIQTSQIGSLPTDEAAKFNASFVSEPLEDDFEKAEKSFDEEFKDLREFESNETLTFETAPQDSEDVGEIVSDTVGTTSGVEKVYEFAEDPASVDTERETRNFSINDLDEANLLEIPRLENFAQNGNLSPELIEAVAQKVIERLSDRTVREIAAEIVPQLADTIVREMTEEQLVGKKAKRKAK